MSQEGFCMSVDEALQFWTTCHELGLNTMEQRMELLRTMVKDKKAKYIRDPNEYIQGKKVLKIKLKKDNNG